VIAQVAQSGDLVARAISGHATVEMQAHYSTVDGAEVRAGLGRVIELAGLRGGYGGGYVGDSAASAGRGEAA
jgi:hypothetical protein